MAVGEDWVCFDVEEEYVGEEDEVLWPHRPEERYGEKTDARKDGRQAEKGQTSNDLVPGFERVDQAGHCWCITTGDRSGKMAKNHQSHSSADSATRLEREREREIWQINLYYIIFSANPCIPVAQRLERPGSNPTEDVVKL